jgi:autotransporter strand-loop-strand O-heptosyltransferase
MMEENRKDHIFIVDYWINTEEKKEYLIQLLKRLREFNVDILLCGHQTVSVEIQNMVDYFIYDKNNPLLLLEEYNDFGVGSGIWFETNDFKIETTYEFHHDYAIWETMRNSFNFAKYLGKKYIHFMEYDNLPDHVQYRQAFLEELEYWDAVIYEYHKNSTKHNVEQPYCATYIFSIRTDVAVNLVDQIKTKKEYFYNRPTGFSLEHVFYTCLTNLTQNIKITDYIPNDNEFNKVAVWNRGGIDRNGISFDVLCAADHDDELYLFINNCTETDDKEKQYLLEITYGDIKKFITLGVNKFTLQNLGKYEKFKIVNIYYLGVEVYSQFLLKDITDFRDTRQNILHWKNKEIMTKPPKQINYHFIDGPFFEIIDDELGIFDISFTDTKRNLEVYRVKSKNNHWHRANLKYYVDWKISVKSKKFQKDFIFDPTRKRILISLESKSVGDTIAWIPYVEQFRKEKNCYVICSTFHNNLFETQYPEINFIKPNEVVHDIYAQYRIGLFKTKDGFDETAHPLDPYKQPLMKIASDILGLQYEELKPRLPKLGRNKRKRVCIGIHSTAQCKYWNNENGWQEVVDYLNGKGYEVRLLSNEEDGYMGNKNPTGVVQQERTDLLGILKVMQESEFFIGVSSGLSWLSWAGGTPTILISGFTDEYLEPTNGIYRVINKDVCHGCWHNYNFDAGDWNWCPVHKNTNRQFECSKQITSEMVITQIEKLLMDTNH